DVVSLIAVHFQNRNVKSGNDLLDPRDTDFYIFRLRLPVGFVGFELFMPEGRSSSIKSHGNVAWLFLLQHFQQGVGKTQHDAGVQSLAVNSWVFAKRKV